MDLFYLQIKKLWRMNGFGNIIFLLVTVGPQQGLLVENAQAMVS